ncbi:uncharacterized protein LOC107693812 [Tachysurus ichikawai]
MEREHSLFNAGKAPKPNRAAIQRSRFQPLGLPCFGHTDPFTHREESFTVEHPGLFYFTKRSEIQENMQLGAFLLRTKQEHDKQVPEVLHDDVGNAL